MSCQAPNCSVTKRWLPEEERILIDNFWANPQSLQKLLDRKFRSIRGKQRDLVGKANSGLLSEADAAKILSVAKVKIETGRLNNTIPIKLADGNKLPTLHVGRKYIFTQLVRDGKHNKRQSRNGRVLKYYPRGHFYLVQLDKYRECISPIDLKINRIEANVVAEE